MPVYRREGDDPATSWNELIRRINELAEECPDVDPMEEVEENHIWTKQDVQDAQDKLLELCEEFSFDPPPNLWKQSTIDALIEAINEGQCCCEEEDREDFPDRFTFAPDGFVIDEPSVYDGASAFNLWEILDWAGWIMQETTPLVTEEVACPVEPGEDPIFIERRTGGRGWVGREFTRWEMWYYTTRTGPVEPIASGDVIDGYISIGEGTWRPEQVCGEALESGTPLGEDDPAWGFPYNVEFVPGPPPKYQITGEDGRAQIFGYAWYPDLAGDVIDDRFMVPAWVTSPYAVVKWIDTSVGSPFEVSAFLRLTCE